MSFFFFNDTATTEIYTLSLHDALPIWILIRSFRFLFFRFFRFLLTRSVWFTMMFLVLLIFFFFIFYSYLSFSLFALDRKSTRLNSSHANISYAVFCLKKKNKLSSLHYL